MEFGQSRHFCLFNRHTGPYKKIACPAKILYNIIAGQKVLERGINMCDMKKYYQMYQEIKKLTPDDTLQLMMHANSKDAQEFFGVVGNFLLQKKQKELVDGKVY